MNSGILHNYSGAGINILPFEGEVYYHGIVINPSQSGWYFNRLMQNIHWKNDEAKLFGRHFITKRKVAWYGNTGYRYSYSKTTKQALTWTEDLLQLRDQVQALTQTTFNSCLLNLYHDGDEGMAWHSDDEKSLVKDSAIASLSLGAARRFLFRHRRTKQTIELFLEPGSLLIMQGPTQSHWLHSLPKSKKVTAPRINLTFKTMLVEGNSKT